MKPNLPAIPEPDAWLHRQGNHVEVSERPLDDDEIARGWTQDPLYTEALLLAAWKAGRVDGMREAAGIADNAPLQTERVSGATIARGIANAIRTAIREAIKESEHG